MTDRVFYVPVQDQTSNTSWPNRFIRYTVRCNSFSGTCAKACWGCPMGKIVRTDIVLDTVVLINQNGVSR